MVSATEFGCTPGSQGGNGRALRQGPWKLVSAKRGRWELYNIDQDRTESNDFPAFTFAASSSAATADETERAQNAATRRKQQRAVTRCTVETSARPGGGNAAFQRISCDGGMAKRCDGDHAITLTAPPPDAGGRGSDLAGCTPGLGWGDWGATPTADGKLRNNS